MPTTVFLPNCDSLYDMLRARLITLAARISAAQYQFLVCLRELESLIVVSDCTYPQWVSVHCHMKVKKAYEMVRVAHKLATLPNISAAFEAGQLSWSKKALDAAQVAGARINPMPCCRWRLLLSTDARREMTVFYTCRNPGGRLLPQLRRTSVRDTMHQRMDRQYPRPRCRLLRASIEASAGQHRVSAPTVSAPRQSE